MSRRLDAPRAVLSVIVAVFLFGGAALVVVSMWLEKQAIGTRPDANELALEIGVLPRDGRQAFLFASGTVFDRPSTRVRLLEYRDGEVAIHSVSSGEVFRGSLRAADGSWTRPGLGIALSVELWSPSGPVASKHYGKVANADVAAEIRRLEVRV